MIDKITVGKEIVFLVPKVPNFIMHEGIVGERQDGFKESPKTPIGDLTDAQLIQIANEWRKNLLELAREKRTKL